MVHESFLMNQVTADQEIEGQDGLCIDPGSFLMSQVTAGQEIKNDAGMNLHHIFVSTDYVPVCPVCH